MDDNSFKTLHGKNGIENLGTLLNFYKDKGYIAEINQQVKAGYADKEKQFYFQYMIAFDDGEKWIIQSTTSIRDRINIQQWHSLHFKQIIKNVSKSIIVYPDSIDCDELNNAVRYYKKITSGIIYSAIDHVISLSELNRMIESKYLGNKNLGKQKALEGDNLEKLLVEILNNSNNFIKWNENISYEAGFYYPYFHKILDGVGIPGGTIIKSIDATRNIPKLPSGGKPKTDVFLTIKLMDNSIWTYTFSCKRSSSEWVTVHQYSADRFISVLNIRSQNLQEALYEFQKVGGKLSLSQVGNSILEKEMPKYNRDLAMWVYGGMGGEGDPKIHWANSIIIYKNETSEFEVFKLEEYVNIIINENGHFGTPFKWTFPSGGKGKWIQLKGKVI